MKMLFRYGGWIVLMCLITALACSFDVMQASSTSMEPTIHDGDYVLVFTPPKVIQRFWPAVAITKRQTVVVLAAPGGTNLSSQDNFHRDLYIKRVVAEEGDRVRMEAGALIRNGSAMEEPYVFYSSPEQRKLDSWPSAMLHQQEVTIPFGCLFVLGDNRAGSLDSRVWGPLNKSDVKGTVVFNFRL